MAAVRLGAGEEEGHGRKYSGKKSVIWAVINGLILYF